MKQVAWLCIGIIVGIVIMVIGAFFVLKISETNSVSIHDDAQDPVLMHQVTAAKAPLAKTLCIVQRIEQHNTISQQKIIKKTDALPQKVDTIPISQQEQKCYVQKIQNIVQKPLIVQASAFKQDIQQVRPIKKQQASLRIHYKAYCDPTTLFFAQQTYQACKRVVALCAQANAQSLHERVQARLKLASLILPGHLGNLYDDLLQQAARQMYTHDGLLSSFDDNYQLRNIAKIFDNPQELLKAVLTHNNISSEAFQVLKQKIVSHPYNQQMQELIQACKNSNKQKIMQLQDCLGKPGFEIAREMIL